jgi:hypothetical protein
MMLPMLLTLSDAWAYEVFRQDDVGGFDRVRVDLGGFMQPRFTLVPDDPQQGVPGELGFSLARARLTLAGFMTGPLSIDPKVSIELMPEARLVDGYLNLSTTDAAQVRIGQFKAPTNRSFLVSDKMTLFPERAAITDLVPRREMGAMLHGAIGEGVVEYQAGAFNGEGTNRLSNVNRKMLYAGRVALSPWGSPGTISELLAVKEPFTVTAGVSAHLNVIGDTGEEEGSSGYNVETFLHWRWVTLQAEYLYRLTDYENVDIPDYTETGFYASAGVYLPGSAWTEEHLVLISRFEQVDEFESVSEDVPLTSADDFAQARREVALGLTYLAGADLLTQPQDLRIQATYAVRQELEELPYDNNELMVSAHVTF